MSLTTLTDEALALHARREPQAAFEVLFERYHRPVYNFLLRQGATEERAEDLFQTTFLKAFRAIASFREESRFKTWLYTIAINALNDELRALKRRGRTAELVEEAHPVVSTTTQRAEWAEELERVKEALAELQPVHRRLFMLVRFQGFSIAEAAGAVGLTPLAAKVTLFRTQKKIGERLAPAREKKI
jgi:RNA polymerase sigma-70 factor (ECF subfamily)